MATIQVRDLPEDVAETYRRRATAAGQSLQTYMRTKLIEGVRGRDKAEAIEILEQRSPALPAQASAGRPSRHPGGSSGVDECVVDAAAVVDALAGKGASAIVLRGLLKESISNAPHLLDAEVGHALRRAVLSDEISEEQARAALDALPYLIDNRYPHSPRLIEYTWQLRHNVTFYDALYVALATALDVPLLTGDSRLAAAPSLPCEIKLVR